MGDPLALAALSPPVPVYTVRDLKRRRAGVPRRGGRPLSRFVGRTQELALLHARLAQAIDGRGQVIGIVGEPGLGKSRLLAEFACSLDGQAVTYGEGHCLPYDSATPYLPVRDLLRQLWGLSDPAPAAAGTAIVQQRLREAGVTSEVEALLLLQLLDVPVEQAPLAVLSPPERKARTFALLRHLFRHASQRQPLVLAVENVHWSDPTSDEWLASLVERLGDTPMLLLVTYRPGYQPPWLGHAVATQMALPRLSLADSLAVLQSVPQAAQLAAPVQQAIAARAAGNPFFVEELTWAAVAHGTHAGSLPLPATVEAVLAVRLDRLPPEAKRLVQIAAVMGPEVPVPLLHRLAGLPEDALQRSLVHLQAAEFLYETQLFPEPVYIFKHALTQEVVYGSLLQERRRALHAQIVEALETLAGDRQDAQVDRLAHHALRGEVWDKALRYSQQAGAKALASSAHREAVVCFEQALEALTHLPPDRTTLEQSLNVRRDLRVALMPFGQWGQILTHMRAAATVAAELGNHRRLGGIYGLIANAHRNLQDYESALAYGQRAHAMATAHEAFDNQLFVNNEMGWIYLELGDYCQAMAYLQQTLTVLQGEWLSPTPNIRHSVQARVLLGQCLTELGKFADGVAYGDEALQVAEAGGRPYERLAVYWRVGYLHVRQGTLHQAIPLLERAVALGQDANIPLFYRPAAANLALAYALAGRATDALSMLRQIGETTDLPYAPLVREEACLLAGCVEEAHRLGERGLAHAREYKTRGQEARALWLLGEIAMHGNSPDAAQAEAHYRQALALAEELGMRPLQAHCHRGLGTLYATTGQREQAHTALAAAIALYRAMDMTFWLPQAEAVLAQVE
jgi:tetratricopeptide (TPR) repeat protein